MKQWSTARRNGASLRTSWTRLMICTTGVIALRRGCNDFSWANSVALRGAEWEQPMTEAATAVELIQLSGDTDAAKNTAALAVTGDLRLRLARALESSLWSPDGILIADPTRRLPTIW